MQDSYQDEILYAENFWNNIAIKLELFYILL